MAPGTDEIPKHKNGKTTIDKEKYGKSGTDLPDESGAKDEHHDRGSIVENNQPGWDDPFTCVRDAAIGTVFMFFWRLGH